MITHILSYRLPQLTVALFFFQDAIPKIGPIKLICFHTGTWPITWIWSNCVMKENEPNLPHRAFVVMSIRGTMTQQQRKWPKRFFIEIPCCAGSQISWLNHNPCNTAFLAFSFLKWAAYPSLGKWHPHPLLTHASYLPMAYILPATWGKEELKPLKQSSGWNEVKYNLEG